MTDDNAQTPPDHWPAVGGPVEHTVGRPLPKRATPGQVAHAAMRARAGGETWEAMKAQWPASVRDWECVAAAVLLHDAAAGPAAQRVAEVLGRLRKSLVKIGEWPHSILDTSEDVAMIDSLLSACDKTPNVGVEPPKVGSND